MRAKRISLAIKVPAVVLAFMALVASSSRSECCPAWTPRQTHHLEDLAAVHLDGLATALIDPVIREDTWEVFDILDRARQSHAGLKPTTTLVATAEGGFSPPPILAPFSPARPCRLRS